ncbi:MAG TPA: hypothetical protein VHL77_06175 [Ferruginibacter sp.]|jgi:hypothetical protein|nr:hypothetical protein [Ferruginibacter sp.]
MTSERAKEIVSEIMAEAKKAAAEYPDCKYPFMVGYLPGAIERRLIELNEPKKFVNPHL